MRQENIPPFSMPMFHDWVPKGIRPWIYLLQAFCFQFSGGVYLGAMNDMIGEYQWMREDVQFLMYCNLAGMAIWFPVLFRTKFRFTNKALLMGSALTIIVCNLLTMHKFPLPLMWVVCFIAGVAKIQGTFENLSNIQLWMTPKRDFGVFFPILHIVLLTAIEGAGFLAAWFAFHMHWRMMHWFVIALMLLVLIVQATLTRPFCPMPKEKRVPFTHIDWLSALGWVLFFLCLAYILNYGDWLQWYHSRTITMLTGIDCLLLAFLMLRMKYHPQAYIEYRIVRFRYFRPIILFMALFEVIMSVEHVLENVFYEEVMHYTDLTYETLNQWSLIGVYAGCFFSLGWLKVQRWSQYQLIGIGMFFICLYCVGFYFLVTPEIGYYQLVPPLISRGFGYSILCIAFMWCLHEVMDFMHFFQALCIFNFFHMFGGGCIGGAILSHGIGYYVGDGFARYNGYINLVSVSGGQLAGGISALGTYMNGMIEGLLAQTVKILYGYMIWACLVFIAIFLLWDRPEIRHTVKSMPSWSHFGARILGAFNRAQHRARRIALHKAKVKSQLQRI